MKKIAFCFLIYDVINHNEIWSTFFKNVDKNKYNIYIHYKHNTPLQYFEEYKLKSTVETQWGHISIVLAQNLLLEEALKDPQNQHFIFVSNSCVPFKNFNEVYESLNPSYSYFNVMPQDQCFPRCDKTIQFIDKKDIQKSSQWCILNIKHAELMITHKEYIGWFDYEPICCPDEHCYITAILKSHLEDEIIRTENSSNDATTFTNWHGMDYKYPSIFLLKNYDFISEEEVDYLLNSKCLFGRKFNLECQPFFLNHPNYLRSIEAKA